MWFDSKDNDCQRGCQCTESEPMYTTNVHNIHTHILEIGEAVCRFSCALSSPSLSDDIIPWQCHHSYRCCLQNLELHSYCVYCSSSQKEVLARGAPLLQWKKMNGTRNRVTTYANGLTAYKWLHTELIAQSITVKRWVENWHICGCSTAFLYLAFLNRICM